MVKLKLTKPLSVLLLDIVLLLIPNLDGYPQNSRDNLPEWNHLIVGYGAKRCYKIPSNFTLCRDIGYEKMILPNFLQHETISEVTLSAKDWQKLQMHCHNDTRRFLCSLYAPVCVPNEPIRKIQPCRELCESVKKACHDSMNIYGYKWPDILHCERFPRKYTSLCIQGTEPKSQQEIDANKSNKNTNNNFYDNNNNNNPQFPLNSNNDPFRGGNQQSTASTSNSCNQPRDRICQYVFSTNNLNEKYCRSTTVLRAKIKQLVTPNFNYNKFQILLHKKSRIMKSRYSDFRLLREPIKLPCACDELANRRTARQGRWLLMGTTGVGGQFELLGMMRWQRHNKEWKKKLKKIRRQEQKICGSAFVKSEIKLKGLGIHGQRIKKRRNRRKRNKKQFNDADDPQKKKKKKRGRRRRLNRQKKRNNNNNNIQD